MIKTTYKSAGRSVCVETHQGTGETFDELLERHKQEVNDTMEVFPED